MLRRHFLEEEAGGAQGGTSTSVPGGGTPSITSAPAGGGGTGTPPPPGAGGAGGGTGGGTNGNAGGTSGSWMDSIPAEIRNDPSIQLFKESGVAGMAKSWVSAQAMMGKDKVIIPGEKATPEEWGAFYSKLGRPESADKYEFKLPDGQKMDENFAKGFKDIAFKSGMSPKQVQDAVAWYASEAGKAVESQQIAQQAELKGSLDAYRESLGGQEKFMGQVDKARQALRAINDPKLVAWLDKTGAGSRPEIIEHFAKLAGMMSEDKLRDGTGVAFGEDPAVIEKEIRDKESTLYSRMGSMTKMDVQAASEDLVKLRERLEASRTPRQ